MSTSTAAAQAHRHLATIAFAVGLGVVGWIGYGYLGSNTLALTITVLIAAFYLAGAMELRRFRGATASLRTALGELPEQLPSLGKWIDTLPAALQGAVRLRVEGERVALPGPALTPYLVGLLVLLGMLGTFLGMVVTLNGAVMALESTTDLATIRAALAAPIKGLGLAFGTSIAGVAASAMLGLVSVLLRRDRLQVAQLLDARIATRLRVFSRAHQREQTLENLQLQARAMPELVDRMQAMMEQMQRHEQQLGDKLLSGQERFYQHAQTAYSDLAASVDRTLSHSLQESARVAGSTIQPLVEATMTGISRESAGFQQKMSDLVQQQLEAMASRFDSTVGAVAGAWSETLQQHDGRSEALAHSLQQSLAGFNDSFEQRAAALLASVDERHAQSQQAWSRAVDALVQQSSTHHAQVAERAGRQLDAVAERTGHALAAVAEQFGASTGGAAQAWHDALAQQQQDSRQASAAMQAAVAALVQGVGQQSADLLQTLQQAHATLRTELASGEQQRLAGWTSALEAMAASLRDDAQQAQADALARQTQICDTLEQTARGLQGQAAEHARDTIAEMSRLIATASEAPRAAAQVVDALREKLSDSMARDNDMLAERSRIMETLSTLLTAVNQAANEQRSAIDRLVASAATMLEQAGARVGETLAQAAQTMEDASTQAAAGSIEIASMGEAFSVAVQQFGASSEALTAHLQRIEAALDKSGARSDEQLAYYVAQAREIVDLSISSQKQIVEDLQQLAIRQPPPVASEVD